jgi:predicted Fe-S protein YdhL (DUF1289 family)
MPLIPKVPITAAVLLYRGWKQLPPKQRQQVLDLARQHGPAVAAKAVAASKQAATVVRKRPPS